MGRWANDRRGCWATDFSGGGWWCCCCCWWRRCGGGGVSDRRGGVQQAERGTARRWQFRLSCGFIFDGGFRARRNCGWGGARSNCGWAGARRNCGWGVRRHGCGPLFDGDDWHCGFLLDGSVRRNRGSLCRRCAQRRWMWGAHERRKSPDRWTGRRGLRHRVARWPPGCGLYMCWQAKGSITAGWVNSTTRAELALVYSHYSIDREPRCGCGRSTSRTRDHARIT